MGVDVARAVPGIVGFSQGAAAGLILCESADAADASFASLRCAVLCAGYAVPSRDAIDRPAISDRHVRVMFIAGDADEAVPRGNPRVRVAGPSIDHHHL